MAQTTIGLLHPGEMGSAVGAAARSAGSRVLWASEGRSKRTREYALQAGLEDTGSLAELVKRSDVILSVCPPHSATDVAQSVAALKFDQVFVDANAVAPGTTRKIAKIVSDGGATFIDGGIIGLPPTAHGSTRLYLSGAGGNKIAALFQGTLLEAIALDAPIGAASALKMAYASWTKQTSALVLAIRALAIAEGVDEALVAEWKKSMPDLLARTDRALKDNTRKAWRFIGEMEEMAATFAACGLPDGFPLAARDIYRKLEAYKDTTNPPSLDEVARAIRTKS